MRGLVICLVCVMFVSPVHAHELQTYTVLIKSDQTTPANVTSGVYSGDSVWFWMVDNTENASFVVTLEKGNTTLESPILTRSCALDDEGNKTDEACQVRFDVNFNQSDSIGIWNVTYHRFIENVSNSSWEGIVEILEDDHSESPRPGLGDCFGTSCVTEEVATEAESDDLSTVLVLLMGISIIGMIGVGISYLKPKNKI